MNHKVTRVHPNDNVLVALTDLLPDDKVQYNGEDFVIYDRVPAKHKFVENDLQPGDEIFMYGVLVGKTQAFIPKGGRITTTNVKHAAKGFEVHERKTNWQKPDISKFVGRTFMGYHRADGKVGTANYWLVIPLVFCENKNIEILEEALIDDLGYGRQHHNKGELSQLIKLYQEGKSAEDLLNASIATDRVDKKKQRIFENVDGIKFLIHQAGCGGTREDAQSLCGLLAGYITHSNVAGATILSLGCQNAQAGMLQQEIKKRDPVFSKPLYILDQQQIGKGDELISKAIKQTFVGLTKANTLQRSPAPLSKLCIGLECGGSDGFSGISANPAVGYASDLLVALGGAVILSEFPELCGVEQDLSDRCMNKEIATRFGELMSDYNARAKAVGSGFDMNPSPGNIKDGLITDAIKSAGAAKKGGTSPVVDVLDYAEMVTKSGLNLLCTPGNDVESTTAEVGSGANVVLFTTGLGTPTGNPIAPVVKISSNTVIFQRMNDIIDVNTGGIIEGSETIEQAGERILEHVIKVAGDEEEVSAVRRQQNDFIPWKRGVSL